jgi:hypothetical protein
MQRRAFHTSESNLYLFSSVSVVGTLDAISIEASWVGATRCDIPADAVCASGRVVERLGHGVAIH